MKNKKRNKEIEKTRIYKFDEELKRAGSEEQKLRAKKGTKGKRKSKDQENEKNPKSRKLKKLIKFCLILLCLFVVFLGIKTAIEMNKWISIATEMKNVTNSVVLDSNNNELAKIGEERKQIYKSQDKIPENLKNAYVSIEDQRFFKHHGVDMKRTTSAIASYIIHFGRSSFGGSTITQQLVKNITGDSNRSIGRKITEWNRAFALETSMSKDEILEYYLNIIYIGPNVYGVGAGSKYYFDKNVNKLNLAECAFLAGINNSPASYNPFDNSEESRTKINNRTKTVLGKMKELEYISEEEYNKAVEEVESGLKFKNGEVSSEKGVYSYHTDALINECISDLKDKFGISTDFATNYLYLSGSTIYSTRNNSVQSKIEAECKKGTYILKSTENPGATSQAAMVVIEPDTGRVLGCVGGLGTKTEARSLNRATQSLRQTGSSLKPLAVLAPGIDKKKFTASTIYDDKVKEFEPGFAPTDLGKELGKITVRRAVESSQNIPFVEMIQEISTKTSLKYLKKMGITTLTKVDDNIALSLGALDKGISPLEMAAAYNTIANDGIYIEPVFYTRISKKNGTTFLENKQKKKRVFSKEVAYILKSLLQQPVKGSSGTAVYCRLSGIDVGAKTGTSDENYDRWLCGFTPYYTAVTWFGYDKHETVHFNNQNPAGIIWANVMRNIHYNKADAEFTKPSGVITCKVCAESGKLARTGCDDTYEEYYLKNNYPDYCDKHSGSKIGNMEKKSFIDNIKSLFMKTDTSSSSSSSSNNTTNSTKNNTKKSKENTTKKNETVEEIIINDNYYEETNKKTDNKTEENKTNERNTTNSTKTENTSNTKNTNSSNTSSNVTNSSSSNSSVTKNETTTNTNTNASTVNNATE